QDKIADARIALTGVGDKPWREPGVERMLVGQQASADLFGKISVEIATRINPGSDIHASESYRRSLATVLTRRALKDAWQKARSGNYTWFPPLAKGGLRGILSEIEIA